MANADLPASYRPTSGNPADLQPRRNRAGGLQPLRRGPFSSPHVHRRGKCTTAKAAHNPVIARFSCPFCMGYGNL